MASFNDGLIAELIRQQVRLQACLARLAARTDDEALHDLRIALRKLRSLLRPLRGLPGVEVLDQAAGAVGALSGPLRDREVLLVELGRFEMAAAVQWRRAELERDYRRLLRRAEVRRLVTILDAWPALWRTAAGNGLLPALGTRVGKRLARQRRRLIEALADPAHDRHRLRLLIKRVRYGAEAYPSRAGIPAAPATALKAAQAALGDWHDRLQWLQRAESEADLRDCCAAWRLDLSLAEQRADQALLTLASRLARSNQ